MKANKMLPRCYQNDGVPFGVVAVRVSGTRLGDGLYTARVRIYEGGRGLWSQGTEIIRGNTADARADGKRLASELIADLPSQCSIDNG